MTNDQSGKGESGNSQHAQAAGDGSSDDPHPSTPRLVYIQLCVMMFLQYFIQGSYFPIVSVYVEDALGFNSNQIGVFGSALAVGPLFVPFGLGQLVDRFWPTQIVLAICHLSAGAVMLLLFVQSAYWPVIILGTIYSILYVPSMMLTNSLAFAHLQNREREFPIVRLFGTIGFVAAAWLIEGVVIRYLVERGQDLATARSVAFLFAGASGILMGIFCFKLPKTPPQQSDNRKFAPGVVVSMMRWRYFSVLVVITFLTAIVHKYYFLWNSPYLRDVLNLGGYQGWEQRISSIGQISEVAVMAILGMMIVRLGFKMTLLLGIFAYFARCVVLAAAISLNVPFVVAMTIACLGQALHGFCFACFLATAYMFVDRVSTPDIRGSMQNLYGTLVFGFGMFVGGFAGGQVGDLFTTPTGTESIRSSLGIETTAGLVQFVDDSGVQMVRDWPGMWLSCAVLALACLVAFAILFPRQVPQAEQV